MRISKLATNNKYGIADSSFKNISFGHLVVLAGKNGSGKSRILKIVKEYMSTFTNPLDIKANIQFLPSPINDMLFPPPNSNPNVVRVGSVSSINNQFHTLVNRYIKYINTRDLFNAAKEQTLKTQDILNGNINNISIDYNEFNSLSGSDAIEYVRRITMDITGEKIKKTISNSHNNEDKYIQAFEKLNQFINAFLGLDFSFTIETGRGTFNTKLVLNNRPFNFDELSNGQNILLRFALVLYLQDLTSNIKLAESILIIDEPETHLHPSIQIKLIDALSSIVKEKGQLWIATHSINILAHTDYENVIMVNNGEVYKPSRKSHKKIYDDLIDLEEYREELRSFVLSINDWSYANFIIECFKKPTIVTDIDTLDPQYLLLKKLLDRDETIVLLDFGSGSGRIGHTIKEDNLTKVDYHAYDIIKDNTDMILESGLTKNIYSDIYQIPTQFFDVVIVCNVLHEINPQYWLDNFYQIKRTLKDDGFLLIIEDLELVRGENAHDYGYLILGTNELQVLFDGGKSFEIMPEDKKYANRLYLSAYSKSAINLDNESIDKAISSLQTNIFSKIKNMRSQNVKDEVDARKYAHFSQLYINSTLYLEANKG